MEHHAADELHVEMALAERALGRLAHDREGFGKKVLERLALGQAGLELGRHRLQFVVGLGLELRLERVDPGDARHHGPDLPLVGRTEESLCDGAETQHEISNLAKNGRPMGGTGMAAAPER